MDQAQQKCCQTCAYYEPRSGFCRYYPPKVVEFHDNNFSRTSTLWPKIPCPNLDWCSKWDSATKPHLI